MKETIKLGAILFIITAIAAAILAVADGKTKNTIAELGIKASDEARKEVFSDADSFKEIDSAKLKEIIASNPDIVEIYDAIDGSGKSIGYVIKTSTGGYAAQIEVITGISAEGSLTGMKVVKNSETPGLGTLAAEPKFQDQYKDKSTDSAIEVVKSAPKDNEILALTGATITSKAVTKGVNSAVEASKLVSK